jgi:RNA recognition motif-containing protein
MNIFVGNLSRQVTDEQLRQAFEAFGTVSSASTVRGFGFVEMPNLQEALSAIQGMNGKELEGQQLTVNQAHARESRSGGGYSRSGDGYNRSGGSNRSGGFNRSGGGHNRSGGGSAHRTGSRGNNRRG